MDRPAGAASTSTCPRFVVAFLAAAATGCHGSGDQLLSKLQSVDPEERAAALRKLADRERPEALVFFTRAAKDPAPMVRGEAATALGASLDPSVVDILGELLRDPNETVQGKAALALARIGTDQAKSFLIQQYARRGRATRQVIVEALTSANVPRGMALAVTAEARSIWDRTLRALTSGSLPERVAAAEELGESGRAEAVHQLLPLIYDPRVVLAAAAVRGLGHAGDARAGQPIAELLTENIPELREAAAEALVRLGDLTALPRLQEMALERSSASGLATRAIIAFPAQRATNRALCGIAARAGPEAARAAGRAMRRRGGCPLDPILGRLRNRGERLAALYAVEGLGRNAARTAPDIIALVRSGGEALRLQAIQALTEIGDPAAVNAIRWVYEQELKRLEGSAGERSEKRVRMFAAAIGALGRLRAPGAFKILEAHAPDPSPLVRAAAYVGLVALKEQGMVVARKALTDPDPRVRTSVALAMAEQGTAGQAAFAEILREPGGDRFALLAALKQTGPTPVVADALLSVLKEGGTESAMAAELLGRLAVPQAVQPLMALLDDPGAVARREALIALGQIGDPNAAEVVARDLNHESPDVRAAAAEALGMLRTAPRPDALRALKGDYYARVRRSAEAALARIGKALDGRAEK